MSLKILSSIVILTFFFCCSAQKDKKQEKINTKFNEDYFKSRRKFYGKLTSEQLKNIRVLISNELKIELDENKSILINYHQYGENCYVYKLNDKDAEAVIDNTLNISSRISKKNQTADFFIYSDDAFNVERYKKRSNFVKDSGFFSQTIFTLKENCTAFFILKPNGEFLKQYGFDYFTDVETFLKSK